MGVYIKGMEMPECCGYCPIEYKNYCMVKPSFKVEHAHRHWRCPLIEVPEPHGRLIDADALGSFPYNMDFCDGWEADLWVQNAPTIIPASEEGE